MVDITYTARRALKTGHTAGTDYTISIDIQNGVVQPTPVQSQLVSLSGNTVTTVHRLDQTLAVTTDFFTTTTTPDYDDMAEFIYSVIHGETFSFNPGTGAADAILQGSPSLNKTGVHYSWSFSIRFI